MKPVAQVLTADTRETFWRTLQTFSATRIVIAAVLLLYVSVNAMREANTVERLIDWETCVVYLLLAIGFAIGATYRRKRFVVQLLTQVLTDIVVVSILYIAAGGAKSGLAILYLFPLAGGAILAPLLLALFFTSVATLILLAESAYGLLHAAAPVSPSRAGLYGAAFFTAIYVINRLAAKLIKQEDLAAQRGRELQVQEAINRVVIADMGDGILVVGRDSQVFAANPAVEKMLGLVVAYGQASYKLSDLPSMAPIANAFFAWMTQIGNKGEEARFDAACAFVVVKPGEDVAALQGMNTHWDSRRELAAHLKLRFVKVNTAPLGEDRTVIFMQDVTEIENQAQQLKLASMGRLTASIAHEVRNPLSAISHAAALLNEEMTQPTQARLLKIVSDNAVRLNRMIEDILKLSRKAQSQNTPLELAPFFAELLLEFREAHALNPGMIALQDMHGYRVRFDPMHLREVIVNLLSNALRYASGREGCIRLHLYNPMASRLELHVQDDGPPITPEVRAHLFEPFYTTSSKGTGLGLYVARELCLNNGAMLDYEYRTDNMSNELHQPEGRFVITFAALDPL